MMSEPLKCLEQILDHLVGVQSWQRQFTIHCFRSAGFLENLKVDWYL
uniref:Uncharacterized protein n=1 Tax=Lepeophtheirus salmonis TaxID=72036 RepID=A0A0K2UPH9_LEPSM